MNALINLVTRASSTRKRDLIAPTVSKMTPKMTSKMTPKMTSGTPSGALCSSPSPEKLGKGSGSPNAYKTTEKPPPEPVWQEGRKAQVLLRCAGHPKTPLRHPKTPTRCSKAPPRRPQEAPKTPQKAPKTAHSLMIHECVN